MSCFLNNGHKSCPLSKDGGQAHKPSVEDCAHSNWILLSALFVLFIRCIVYLIHFLTRLIHPLYCKSYSFSHTSYSSAVLFILFIFPHVLFIGCIVYLVHLPTRLIHPLYCLSYPFPTRNTHPPGSHGRDVGLIFNSSIAEGFL
jgi:hypothetical protein